MKPLLLDLFCGAGGAAVGYHRAGFDVVGVDIAPQPHYPFRFLQADALDALRYLWHLDTPLPQAIHASPPCQRHSAPNKGTNRAVVDGKHPDLIGPTRELLNATRLPYVIENVLTAPLRNPVRLCGEMFGLNVIRHRLFETNWPLTVPPHPKHRGRVTGWRHGVRYDGPYVAVYGTGGGKGSLEEWQAGMGIDWMPSKREIAEAIPPAYTEHIGGQLMAHLGMVVDHEFRPYCDAPEYCVAEVQNGDTCNRPPGQHLGARP
ncbi:MAG TPA: DNA methylase [Mycobacterium sp.]|nr:DNA methylase [Mycobacterium sp.]